MKAFALLLVLVVLAAGGWFLYRHRLPAGGADEAQEVSPLATPPAAPLAPPAPPAPTIPPEVLALLQQADAAWAAAGPTPATSAAAPELSRLYTKALRALYNKPGCREREDQLINERLKPLGDTLFFSKQPFPADSQFAVHAVASGESPEAIGRKYGISRELINRFRARDINDSHIKVGESFKVLRMTGQTDPVKRGSLIHIDKGDFTLDLSMGGMFVRRYVCSHGAVQSPTPIGTTHLTNRVWHPDWTHPATHKVIRYGAPEHLLGPIWLPFNGKELGQDGIGIHGYTGTDAKMGVKASNGCIRLVNEQAEELYQTICHPDRTPVIVEIVE